LSNRTGYRMGVPTVPLSELYAGCKSAIEKRGGEVILRSPVRRLRIEGDRVAGVAFDGEHTETAEAYVFAVPHTAFLELIPDEIKGKYAVFENLKNIKVSPITGVHFWFDRAVTQEPFIALLDTTTQWIFNKTVLHGAFKNKSETKANGARQYLQLVISASYDLLQKSRQEIIEICLREVRHALPAAREAQLVKATVIKEVAATFSPKPGVDRWRPKQETDVAGLFLAGDWTDTGWPSTMEGAVRSGYLAAEAVLRAAGMPQKIVQPDLKADGFVSFWA
jgi:uncharacterized protein with NAD-binding domain and iron-sulfur cluster